MADMPFSLICVNCEEGDDMETVEMAIMHGWTGINRDGDAAIDNMHWTHIGICPECREEYEQRDEAAND